MATDMEGLTASLPENKNSPRERKFGDCYQRKLGILTVGS